MARFASSFILGSIIAILLALAYAIPLEAQTGSVRMEGDVWDPSGDPLAGATLTAVEESTGHRSEAVSSRDGYYVFLALEPGTYTVTATAKGFKDVIHRSIFLFSPGSRFETFSFEVSAIDKEIGPNEQPRLIDSDTTLSLSQRDLETLPLRDRNPLALLPYQPGVQFNSSNEEESTINGTRRSMNTLRMDGLSITDPVDPKLESSLLPTNPDSLSDIQIVTTNGKAEYGGSGGAQFVMVSRSGANKWSGSVYDYARDRRLNANEFFNNSSKFPRPGLNQNIYGATASGPIKGKTLVFANFEGNRTNRQLIRNRAVLTSQAKTGKFRWYTPDDRTRDDTTIQSFDIAANDPRHLGIDPAVAAILAKIPDANNYDIGDRLNTGGYRFDNPAHTYQERVAARIDHSLSAKHQLFLRVNWNHSDATDVANNADAPFEGEPSGTDVANNWGFAVGSNYALNPSMINELRVGYLNPKTDLRHPARSADLMLLANSWDNPLDPSYSRSFSTRILEVTDNFSHGRNLHGFKFGFNFRRVLQKSNDYSGVYPNATFGRDHGNAPPDTVGPSLYSDISQDDRETFENLYNDLLGRVESVSQTFNSKLTSTLPAGTARDRSYASTEFAAFVQDTWKIRSDLTLNLGLRYEISTVPAEKNGLQAVLDQASNISNSANIANFKVASGSNWYSTRLKNFAPRVGASWDVYGTGSTVLRGAYGIYYDRLIGGITNVIDQNSYGFSQNVALYPNAAGTDLRLRDGISLPTQPALASLQPAATRSSSIAVLDRNLKTPRVDQLNVTLERRLFGAVVEAGYVRTRGKDLFQYLNLNQTRTSGDFLQAFQELQAYRENGTPVPVTNTLIKIFGTPFAALNALGGSNLDSGQVGIAADNMDRNHYDKYAAAGVSDFYIRNFPQFNVFAFGTNSAKSWYDSVQLGVRKNATNYNIRANYSWSKSMDNESSSGAAYVSSADSFNPESSKAPGDFDRTHVLNVALHWALPFGRNPESDSDLPKWLTMALGGWNLGALFVWESGQRFSVVSGLQTQYSGVASYADLDEANGGSRGMGRIYHGLGKVYWFDTAQAALFTHPKAGNVGTSGRNSFTGPPYRNLDVMIHKRFSVRENQFLQIRAEAYNVLNNTHFGLPIRDMLDNDFGIITRTLGTPRTLQVALRYQF